jgi:hypothetical protein
MATPDLWQTGEKVIITGLFVQPFIFSCFLVITINYHYRLARSPTQYLMEVVLIYTIPDWRFDPCQKRLPSC